MFRLWGKEFKDNHMIKDTTICWMWISTNSSGIPKRDSIRTVSWIRLILIFWKSRWLKNRKREDFSTAWKILSSSISSFHPNKFHWKDISLHCPAKLQPDSSLHFQLSLPPWSLPRALLLMKFQPKFLLSLQKVLPAHRHPHPSQ